MVKKLPVGANGLVLTADSTKPNGVAWEAAGAGTVTSVAAADGTIVVTGNHFFLDAAVACAVVLAATAVAVGFDVARGKLPWQGTPEHA